MGAALTRRHGDGLNSLTIGLYRFGFAAAAGIAFYALSLVRFRRRLDALPPLIRWPAESRMSRQKWLWIFVGVFLVTFTCPTLSTYALFGMDLGVWALLGALGPAYSPPVRLVRSRLRLDVGPAPNRFGWLGAFIAAGGAALTAWLSKR